MRLSCVADGCQQRRAGNTKDGGIWLSANRYGSRAARQTYEACTTCGTYVTLTEATRTGLSDNGDFELHLTEECEHLMSRPVMIYCPPSQAEETFSA